jgi:aspartate aminotransferase
VIVLAPFFAEYEFYIWNHGGRMVVVETDAQCQPAVGRIAEAITPKTRAIIVNSPNNPSGAVYPAGFFDELGESLVRRDQTICVLSDEPYRRLAFTGVVVPEILPRVAHAMIADSFSKSLAVPGERIGYLAISPRIDDAAALIDACVFANRILGFVNAPALWQWAISRAGDACVDAGLYEEKCGTLYRGLREQGYEAIQPRGGFYVFAKTPIADDVAFIGMLKDEGILAVPGTGFGRPGHMRLSVTIPRETIARALPGFSRALARAHGGARG